MADEVSTIRVSGWIQDATKTSRVDALSRLLTQVVLTSPARSRGLLTQLTNAKCPMTNDT